MPSNLSIPSIQALCEAATALCNRAIPTPDCGEDCEHIECLYVVACERWNYEFALKAGPMLEALVAALAAVEKERDALRSSLMHACELQEENYKNRRQLWAMRQTANLLSLPFSHERVQEKYDELERAEALKTIGSIRRLLDETLTIARPHVERNGDTKDARKLDAIAREAGLP